MISLKPADLMRLRLIRWQQVAAIKNQPSTRNGVWC